MSKNRIVLILALFIYILLFSGINYLAPSFLFLPDGSYRPFGIGFKKKTIFPCWLIAILVGAIAYLCAARCVQ